MRDRLVGKVAIITGAASGIGRGIANCFAEEGADVVIADIDMDNASKVAEEVKAFGHRVLVVETDATKEKQCQQLVESTLNTFGKINILVNNVGGRGSKNQSPPFPMTELDEGYWDRAYALNIKAGVFMSRAVVPHMKAQKSGKIINIASQAGKMVGGRPTGAPVNAGLMPYSVFKGGVIMFSRTLARELARDNINVNCICPGLLYTAMFQQMIEYQWENNPALREGLKEPKDLFLRMVRASTPLGRPQTPEDIGRLAAFLASEDSKNITGESILVAGGQVMD